MTRMAISLSPTERRERVALAANHAKSNRVLASELGVEASTIRRDRKFLLTPEDQRPIKMPRPKKAEHLPPPENRDA
jgi:hypothetical protein